MAMCGIETLVQLGSLGKANFKASKYLTAWESNNWIAQDSPRMFVVFLGNTLEENKVISLMKVAQFWSAQVSSPITATYFILCVCFEEGDK